MAGAVRCAAGVRPARAPRSIGIAILLAVVTLGIYTYVWTYQTQAEIKRHSGVGMGGGVGLVVYLVATLFGIGAIPTFFIVPSEVRQMLERAGRLSRVSGLTGFWFLLPLIGAIIWFVKVQGQLNDYWRSLGAAA